MSSTITGRLAKIFKNPKNWVLVVQNEKGTEGRFSTMKDPAESGAVEGAQVEFLADSREFKGKTYWNIKDNTIKVTAQASAPAKGGDTYDLRQQSIVFQHAQKVGAALLDTALKHEAINIGKVKVADRVPFIVETVGELARGIYEDCFNFVNGDKEEEDTPEVEHDDPQAPPEEPEAPADPFAGS